MRGKQSLLFSARPLLFPWIGVRTSRASTAHGSVLSSRGINSFPTCCHIFFLSVTCWKLFRYPRNFHLRKLNTCAQSSSLLPDKQRVRCLVGRVSQQLRHQKKQKDGKVVVADVRLEDAGRATADYPCYCALGLVPSSLSSQTMAPSIPQRSTCGCGPFFLQPERRSSCALSHQRPGSRRPGVSSSRAGTPRACLFGQRCCSRCEKTAGPRSNVSGG